MNTAKTRKPKRAHSVSWQPCECGCGHFYLELYEPNGRAFAQAWLDRADLIDVADTLYAIVERQTEPMPVSIPH